MKTAELELDSLRAEAARNVLNSNNKAAIEKVIKIFSHKKTFERIPGLPYTEEERRESVRRSLESARAGRVRSAEEVWAKYGL